MWNEVRREFATDFNGKQVGVVYVLVVLLSFVWIVRAPQAFDRAEYLEELFRLCFFAMIYTFSFAVAEPFETGNCKYVFASGKTRRTYFICRFLTNNLHLLVMYLYSCIYELLITIVVEDLSSWTVQQHFSWALLYFVAGNTVSATGCLSAVLIRKRIFSTVLIFFAWGIPYFVLPAFLFQDSSILFDSYGRFVPICSILQWVYFQTLEYTQVLVLLTITVLSLFGSYKLLEKMEI